MVQIRVNEGVLEGELINNEYGGTFYSFKGIPYAQPPVGELRFKAPQPVKPWEGILSAKQFGPVCPQFDHFNKRFPENCSEDCLYLNIYTPDIKPSKPLAVMVWIHGGGFSCGSGNDDIYGPEFLVQKNVIIITINYRVDALGFLCLDTEDIPGNAGMKDQVAALRWIKNNIASFGGDPKNITIFGESAGGASVSYHLVSPMSKGLFQRAIAQSGVAFNPWAQSFEPRERALALARKLGCTSEDDDKLYEFFKCQPANNLIAQQLPLTLSDTASIIQSVNFNVVSEKKFGNSEVFFHGDIADALRAGIHAEVDVMVGYTEHEGLIVLSTVTDCDKFIDQASRFPEFFVPILIRQNAPIRSQLDIGRILRDYHLGVGNIHNLTEKRWEEFERVFTMDFFIYGIVQWQKICASRKNNNIFAYKFTCKSALNKFAKHFGVGELFGSKPVACHADDVHYLFNVNLTKTDTIDIDSATLNLINRTTQLWTNFAKYGNPTPDDSLGVKWIPYTIEEQETLDIGEQLTMCKAPDRDDVQFYEEIYRKYLPSYVADK